MQTMPNTANRPRSSNVESERPIGNTARKAKQAGQRRPLDEARPRAGRPVQVEAEHADRAAPPTATSPRRTADRPTGAARRPQWPARRRRRATTRLLPRSTRHDAVVPSTRPETAERGLQMVRSSAMPNRPLRSPQDHEDQQQQGDRIPVGAGQVVAGPVLQHPDEEAAEQGAADLVEAADDRRRERQQAEADAAVPPGVRGRRDEQRGDDHEHGVDPERVQDHPPDGDPENLGRRRALRAASICRPVEVRRRNSCRARITTC